MTDHGAAGAGGTFRLSLLTTPFVAVVVGFFGSLAVVLQAAGALGADRAETTSWITGLCVAMAASATVLSLWHRIPVVTAWSTPGAALIAATAGTLTLQQGVGAFLLAAGLILATALIGPLGRLVGAIPTPIAAAMLAGVLLKFVTPVFDSAMTAPLLVLPLIALFLVVRALTPTLAVIALLIAGIGLAAALGQMKALPIGAPFGHLQLVTPVFDLTALIGLGVPLYIVTMASQNLPGAAVLRAAGYQPPMTSALAVTGLVSVLTAPFASHTSNLAAISAAICTGPDTHPDPARRWPAGVVYGLLYGVLALFAGWFVAVFQVMPGELVKTIAGLALLGSLVGAVAGAMAEEKLRFAAVLTFGVSASSVVVAGIGSAFWGLAAGLAAWGIERAVRSIREGDQR